MRPITDIVSSLWDFRFMGKTLSKRPKGLVALSFFVLVLIHVIAAGMWFNSAANIFIDVALDAAKPRLPNFSIADGKLTMHSEEPYVFTHEDFYEIMIESVLAYQERRSGREMTEDLREGIEAGSYASKDSFCVVMDTTGTYKDTVSLDDYSKYAVVTENSMEVVDRVQSLPGEVIPLGDNVKGVVDFSPDSVDELKKPLQSIATGAVVVGLLVWEPIHFLIKALIASGLVWLVFLMFGKRSFGEIYKISLYALSPVVTLLLINRFMVNVHGLIFQVVYFLFIILAVIAIPVIKKEESVTRGE